MCREIQKNGIVTKMSHIYKQVQYFCTQFIHFAHNSYILHTALFSCLVNIEMFLSLKVEAANDTFPPSCFVQDGATLAFTSVHLL